MATLFLRYKPGEFILTGLGLEPINFKSRHEAKNWCAEHHPEASVDERDDTQHLGEEFHMMIGICIAQWASVDNELFRIFRHCVGREVQSAIIFNRVPTLSARVSYIDELVRSLLPKRQEKSGSHDHPDVKKWEKAIKNYNKLLETRNWIAHHPTIAKFGPFRVSESSVGEEPPSWFEIYASQHQQLRGKGKSKSLKIIDLETHLIDVLHFRDRLHNFFYEVLTKPKVASPAPSLQPRIRKSQRMGSSTKLPRRQKPSPA